MLSDFMRLRFIIILFLSIFVPSSLAVPGKIRLNLVEKGPQHLLSYVPKNGQIVDQHITVASNKCKQDDSNAICMILPDMESICFNDAVFTDDELKEMLQGNPSSMKLLYKDRKYLLHYQPDDLLGEWKLFEESDHESSVAIKFHYLDRDVVYKYEPPSSLDLWISGIVKYLKRRIKKNPAVHAGLTRWSEALLRSEVIICLMTVISILAFSYYNIIATVMLSALHYFDCLEGFLSKMRSFCVL